MEIAKPGVAEEQLNHIGRILESGSVIDKELVTGLRKLYPHLRFTLCSEDDTGEREPYKSFTGVDLHLVASAPGSCSHLTYYPENCTGILIALHEE